MTAPTQFFQFVLLGQILSLSACSGQSESELLGARQDDLSSENAAKKAVICHEGSTISVAEQAISAHLRHGDAIESCPAPCSPATCDDGDLCTSDACDDAGACVHSPVSCDDSDPCTIEACDPRTGCTSAPADGASCDDGNDCTSGDVCASGRCTGSSDPDCCLNEGDCSDGDSCTSDRCVAKACANVAVDCAVSDRCQAGFCDPTSGTCSTVPVSCDDSNPCTLDSCAPDSGCASVPEADGSTCDDGDASTNADSCQGGVCVSGPRCADGVVETPEQCDDGNLRDDDGCSSCTVDASYWCEGSPSACEPNCSPYAQYVFAIDHCPFGLVCYETPNPSLPNECLECDSEDFGSHQSSWDANCAVQYPTIESIGQIGRPHCDTSGANSGQCVECTMNLHCPNSRPVCNAADRCDHCTSNGDCMDRTGFCNLSSGACE